MLLSQPCTTTVSTSPHPSLTLKSIDTIPPQSDKKRKAMSTTSFFSLARELRDLIYMHLLIPVHPPTQLSSGLSASATQFSREYLSTSHHHRSQLTIHDKPIGSYISLASQLCAALLARATLVLMRAFCVGVLAITSILQSLVSYHLSQLLAFNLRRC